MELTINETVRLVLMVSANIIMLLGVRRDCKERKFPNEYLLCLIAIGVMYCLSSGFLMEGLFGFFIVNLIGVFFHKWNLMAAGDMKFLSSLFLFINIRDWQSCIMLIAYMLLVTMVMGFFFYKRNNKNMSEEMKRQMTAYKALFMYRLNLFEKNEFKTKEEMLEKTIPFTEPMFIAFLLTLITRSLCVFL